MEICPNCKAKLIEDASENIMEKDNEYIVDAFFAKVCSDKCGYVERMK